MNNFKWIIQKIENIPYDKTYIKYLENQLQLLKDKRELQAVRYDRVGNNKSGISDKTGETAVRITEEEYELKILIDEKKCDVELLEGIIKNILTFDERQIIELMYKEKRSYQQVANRMGIVKSTVQEKRKKALNTIIEHYKLKRNN